MWTQIGLLTESETRQHNISFTVHHRIVLNCGTLSSKTTQVHSTTQTDIWVRFSIDLNKRLSYTHTGWQYRYLEGPCGWPGSCWFSCCCCMRCCRPRALLMHFCSLASAAIVLLWVLALPSCMENLSLAIMQKRTTERKEEQKKKNAEKKEEPSYEGPACGPFLCYRKDKSSGIERRRGDGGIDPTFTPKGGLGCVR